MVSATDPRPLATPTVDDDNPWPGLLAFSYEIRRFFYGRTEELEDLFRRVRRELLTVLYAQSGLGKTSLLQAGLFPRLRDEGFLPIPIRLDYGGTTAETQAAVELPGRQIQTAIANAIAARGLREASDPLRAPGPWEYLHDLDLELRDETGSPLIPVLVFDQFEELFTLGAGRRDEGRFADLVVQQLGDLIENRPPRALERALAQDPALVDRYDFTRSSYRVLLSLREDYLPHLHGLRKEMPSIILNNLRLTRFNRRQALEVVERPAAKRGLVSRQVAEAIVRTVAGLDGTAEAAAPAQPRTGEHRATESMSQEREGRRIEVDPALLSLFCRELNTLRAERGDRSISLELVAQGSETVLRDFYLHCFKDLSPPPEPGVKAFVEDYLLTSKGYRDRLTLERAAEILELDYHGRAAELRILVDRRLLQVEERGATPQIELAHDVLAPIAMRERMDRVRNEALREEEERRVAALRRAEQEEREAKAREAAAAVALATVRRRQRRTLALLGVVGVAAAVAVYSALTARGATRKAEAAEITARAAETSAKASRDTARASRDTAIQARKDAETAHAASRESEQSAIRERKRAEEARDAAARNLLMMTAEQARADSSLEESCRYVTDMVNLLGDSSNTNQQLKSTYMPVLERSDLAVDRMIRRDSLKDCPRRLDARVGTVSTQIRRSLDEQDRTKSGIAKVTAAREKGYHALEAVRALARYNDSASRAVAAQSYADLTYEFYLIDRNDSSVRDSLIRTAAEGAVVAARVDPASDRSAFDRVARLHHYGARALTQQRRFEHAKRVLQSGFEAVRSGKARRDQDQEDLLFTESQLWLRLGEVDSTLKRVREAEHAFDSAIVTARTRLERFQLSRNRRWLALMQKSKGDLALDLNHPEEALPAYDSSAVNYGIYQRRMRETDVHDTLFAAQGLQLLSQVRLAQQRALLQLGRVAQAVASARESIDSAVIADRLGSRVGETPMLDTRYLEVIANLDRYLPRQRADSIAAAWFQRDSASYAQVPAGSTALKQLSARGLDLLLDAIHSASSGRFRADSAGKSKPEAARLRALFESPTLRYRLAQVGLRREQLARSGTDAARDSLGVALGNLSWTYLLLGHPAEAVAAAQEGIDAAPKQDYIIPNLVNAQLLSVPEQEAAASFNRFAGRMVEVPKIRFECAMGRDLALLRDAGLARQEHIDAFHRMLGGRSVPCPRNAQIP